MRFALAVLLASTSVVIAEPRVMSPFSEPARPPLPDRSHPLPTEHIPWWSRLQWSVAIGTSSRHGDDGWDTSFALSPQAGVALWVRDGECASGGSSTYPVRGWRRWSLAVTVEARPGSDATTQVGGPELTLTRRIPPRARTSATARSHSRPCPAEVHECV